jgi:hypothetical protein
LAGCGVNIKYFLPLLGYEEMKSDRGNGKGRREKDMMEMKIRKCDRSEEMALI